MNAKYKFFFHIHIFYNKNAKSMFPQKSESELNKFVHIKFAFYAKKKLTSLVKRKIVTEALSERQSLS